MFDLGCRPGTDLAFYATAVGPTGTVVGLDHDQTAIRDAQQATAHLPQFEVITGEAHQLGFPTGSFDAVHTDRVLQHLHDPGAVVNQLARLLRPGGVAVFAEPDWRATLVVEHPDPTLVRSYTRYVVEHQVRNSRIGSQPPRLAHRAGLHAERVIPITATYTDVHAADQVLGSNASPSEQSSTA